MWGGFDPQLLVNQLGFSLAPLGCTSLSSRRWTVLKGFAWQPQGVPLYPEGWAKMIKHGWRYLSCAGNARLPHGYHSQSTWAKGIGGCSSAKGWLSHCQPSSKPAWKDGHP